MKQFIPLILLLGLTLSVQAQGEIYFEEETTIVMGVEAGDLEGVGYNHLISTFTEPRNLRWTVNILDITTGPDHTGWQVAICDPNLCYEPVVTTETFVAVADSLMTMDVHVRPNGMAGQAIVEIIITDEDDENISVTNTYYFNTEPSGTTEVFQDAIKVYPNPTSGLFALKNSEDVATIQVMSLTGQMVKQINYNQSRWYDLTNLPRGTYMLRMLDRSAQVLTTKLLNKL